MTPKRERQISLAVVLVAGLGLVALALWQDSARRRPRTIRPIVMGTTSRLTAFGSGHRSQVALESAKAELDAVEAAMSRHDPDSELSRFNAAPAGADVPVSPALLAVMRFGRQMARKTGGAFDVTMQPLGGLWSAAAEQGRLPDGSALAAAREKVGFEKLVIGEKAIRKTVAGVAVSLDAIAKGYAVDRAVEAMHKAGVVGGLVEVGGDLRCFGIGGKGKRWIRAWTIGVQSPWDESTELMTLLPLYPDIAVCTSGNYRRFVEIDGVRYSHIIDPRTGRPADAIPSVTVIAPDAMTADGWATALSVLTLEEGRALIEKEEGVEAMWISGTADAPQLRRSSGFEKYVRVSQSQPARRKNGVSGRPSELAQRKDP